MDIFSARAPWFIAGPLIGLLVVILLWAANKPLGALGGYIDLVGSVRRLGRVGWRAYVFLGIVIGGALSALAAGGLAPTSSYGALDAALGTAIGPRALVLAGAGVVMGFGARLAGGCTSGHGVCGTALGSPRSIASTAMFMVTAVVAAHALGALVGGAP